MLYAESGRLGAPGFFFQVHRLAFLAFRPLFFVVVGTLPLVFLFFVALPGDGGGEGGGWSIFLSDDQVESCSLCFLVLLVGRPQE